MIVLKIVLVIGVVILWLMNEIFVVVIALLVQTVQERQMAVLIMMNVELVILIAPMIALKIVLVNGVVIFPMMNAVSVVVIIAPVQIVQAYQMAVTL